MKYETPVIMELGRLSKGLGWCTTGSANFICNVGSSATGSCATGSGGNNIYACTTGTDTGLGGCGSGNVTTADCVTGTGTSVACASGSSGQAE